MFKLPWELERPSVPAANPSTPRISDEPDQSEKRTKAKRKRKAVTFLREEEIDRLFSVIDSIRDRAMFRLAYHAGLRASEIGILQLRDYDPKAAKIFVHRLKGSNSGEHYLVREEARALRAWLQGARFLSGPDLPVEAKAADRPHDAPSVDEEVRRGGRHSAASPAFPRAQERFGTLHHLSESVHSKLNCC